MNGLIQMLTQTKEVLFTMPVEEITYSFGCVDMHGLVIRFTEDSVDTLNQFKQKSGYNEAGGMLFGHIDAHVVTIREVSIPNATDQRSRLGFVLGKSSVNGIISRMFKRGFHYLGDWHTHSDPKPIPSAVDINTIRASFNKTRHDLNLMIIFILSNHDFNHSHLSVTDGKSEYICHVR
jgi:integrative and conjugative element protein (TIGR02256 family)